MSRPSSPVVHSRFFILAAFALLSACARPLAQNEADFATALFGETIETDGIEILAGIGLTPLPREYPALRDPNEVVTPPPPPRAPPADLCERKQSTRFYWDWPAAFVVDDNIYYSYRYYTEDAFAGLPESALYPSTVLLAHELVHVWQWQNRSRTSYSSLAAGAESLAAPDPYWWVPEGGREFLTYGYEQQAAIVQDFVCFALFDSGDPKLSELADILRPVLPVDDFLRQYAR